jgi:hypothetical protein
MCSVMAPVLGDGAGVADGDEPDVGDRAAHDARP